MFITKAQNSEPQFSTALEVFYNNRIRFLFHNNVGNLNQVRDAKAHVRIPKTHENNLQYPYSTTFVIQLFQTVV